GKVVFVLLVPDDARRGLGTRLRRLFLFFLLLFLFFVLGFLVLIVRGVGVGFSVRLDHVDHGRITLQRHDAVAPVQDQAEQQRGQQQQSRLEAEEEVIDPAERYEAARLAFGLDLGVSRFFWLDLLDLGGLFLSLRARFFDDFLFFLLLLGLPTEAGGEEEGD